MASQPARSVYKLAALTFLGIALPWRAISAQTYGGYPNPVSNPLSGLMLNLPGTGTNPTAINFSALPKLLGTHAVVSQGDPTWQFRLHNYLAYYDNKYWLQWSHGPTIEDDPTQHVRYVTSTDGTDWSSEALVVGPSGQSNFRHIARGFWQRDDELYALASHDEAGRYFGDNLELRGYHWNASTSQWDYAGVIADDTINNFEPKQISTGEWIMSRRGNNYGSDPADRSWLIGGVNSISDWSNVPIPATTARLEEPLFYELPDDNLVALYRDNSGSKRIFRSFSTDHGQSWTQPVETNFPDATAKFFTLETSRGYQVMIGNANPAGRNPLTLAVSQDGLVYTRMGSLNIPGTGSFQYPHAIEHDGDLLIAFSRNKTSIETFRVSLDEIDRLFTAVPPPNPGFLLNGDFEDLTAPFPNHWSITRGDPAQHGGLGGSSTGVFLHKQAQGGDRIRQDLASTPGSQWELDLLFATEDPGGSDARGFNIIINNSQGGGNLNLRVNGDGSVQTVTSTPTTTWHIVSGLGNAVQFSIDSNGDGDFSDSQDVLNVHRLVLRGNYESDTPSYTVLLSAANETGLTKSGNASFWFGASPPGGSSIEIVHLSAQNSGGSFLVDQAVLRTPLQPGDFDGDGDVDGADFVVWQTHFPTASGASLIMGDGDGDGDVDGADFVIWQTHFPSGSAPQTVPEPPIWIAACLGFVAFGPLSHYCKRGSLRKKGDSDSFSR